MLIGRYGGLFGITWFNGVGCMSGTHTWLWRLAKDWERPTKRAIMAIIMQSDKTSLIKA